VEAPVRQELMSVGCSVEVIEKDGTKTTKASQEGYGHPLILFMLAQLLLGCGGSPLFTLGITYVDDHVPADSSSIYIGKRVDGFLCIVSSFYLSLAMLLLAQYPFLADIDRIRKEVSNEIMLQCVVCSVYDISLLSF
jgi:hypothetical protein